MLKINLENLTIEELFSKKRTISVIIYLISILIFLFIGYLSYVLYSGIWTDIHLAGIISITVLVSVLATNTSFISDISKEIKRRGGQ